MPRKRRRQEGECRSIKDTKVQTIICELSVFTLDKLSINIPSKALKMKDISNQLYKLYYNINIAEKKRNQTNQDTIFNYFHFRKAYQRQEPPNKYLDRVWNSISHWNANITALKNANIGNFNDAIKCDLLKIKIGKKFIPVPVNDPYIADNPPINLPDIL
ncbi:hypothetical protein RclHR1_01040038 [Rhizophagus clarus]|nr:hypothetical protein RclHR1_01040038 [Rhizophagus clarus]